MVLSAILTLSSMLQFPTWPLTRLADRNTERTRQALTRNIILTASVTYENSLGAILTLSSMLQF